MDKQQYHDKALSLLNDKNTYAGWHRLFLTLESTRGIRTLVVVFELLEEMVAWGCRNSKFNERFQSKTQTKLNKMLLDLKSQFSSAFRNVMNLSKVHATISGCVQEFIYH